MVHLVRGSLSYVNWKHRRAVEDELRGIYRAPTEAVATAALEDFARSPWGEQYPTIATMWRRPLGAHPLGVCLPAGDSPPALHDECDREPAHAAPQDHQNPGPFSDGRSR
jgi:hypothetical protein